MFGDRLSTSQQQLNAQELNPEQRMFLVRSIKHRTSSKALTEVCIYFPGRTGCILRHSFGGSQTWTQYLQPALPNQEMWRRSFHFSKVSILIIRKPHYAPHAIHNTIGKNAGKVQFRGKDKHSSNDHVMSVSTTREWDTVVSRWVREGPSESGNTADLSCRQMRHVQRSCG